MDVTLTQLATFARVAQRGNFTRAAEDLYLTQPAVTHHVHALERHFQVRLVEVIGRHPELTDAGIFLAARVPEILSRVAALERDMQEYAQAQMGELRLGATLTIGTYVVPRLLAQFQQEHPQVQVQVTIANTPMIVAQVREGLVHVGLVEGEVQEADIATRPFQEDTLVLVAAPMHPFAQTAPASFAEVVAEPLVMREAGSGTRERIEHAFILAGATPNTVLALPSGEGVARAVEAGIGIAWLSPLVIHDAVRAGRLVVIPCPALTLTRVFAHIWVRERVSSPLAQAFAQMLSTAASNK